MTKSDLKTGYIVTERDGDEWIVILNPETCYTENYLPAQRCILLQDIENWNDLSNYNEDLTHFYFSSRDIVKIEKAPHPYAFIDLNYKKNERKLLWKRKENSEKMVMKYKTKPCKIEAIEWTGTNVNEIREFTKDNCFIVNEQLRITTLEGIMGATVGDYIIKGLKGEYYPCKADVFHKKYELIKE